jgi:FkbM family methyltransferase
VDAAPDQGSLPSRSFTLRIRRLLAPVADRVAGTAFEGVAYRGWEILSRALPHGRDEAATNADYDELTVSVMRRVLGAESNGVDVGAHRGTMLRHLITSAPRGRHFAFEPLPTFAAGLRRRFRGVDVREVALSDAPGVAVFHHVVTNPSYSGLSRRRYPNEGEEASVREISVRTARLDDEIPQDVPVHLLKIDVEGGEAAVVRGARSILRRWRPVVVFEHGWDDGRRPDSDTTGSLWEELVGARLGVYGLATWLADGPPLSREGFEDALAKGEYYFLAAPTGPAGAGSTPTGSTEDVSVPAGCVRASQSPGTTPVRVLLVDGSERGGITRYTQCLRKALESEGAVVDLCAPDGLADRGLSLPGLRWGPDVSSMSRTRIYAMRLAELVPSGLALGRALLRSRPDLVHFQTEVVPGFDHLALQAISRRLPVVVTAHDPVPLETVSLRSSRRQARRWRAADAVIVHAEEQRSVVRHSAPSAFVHVVPVDLPLGGRAVPPEEARERLGLVAAPTALLLGLIRPYKGLALLAEAWPSVVEEVPGARLAVVGETYPSPELAHLEGLRGVEVHSTFLAEEELDCWAAAADVLVLPYERGAHSGILHRALAAGTPVLASPCLAEEVERTHAGRVVCLDPRAWSRELVACLSGSPPPPPPPLPPDTGRATAAGTLEVYRSVLRHRA